MSQSDCVPATVLNPPGFSRKGHSLSLPEGGGFGSRSLPFRTNAAWSGSRCLYAGHHLANKRAPARLIPGSDTHPGFDANRSYFDTSKAATHVFPTPT
jgi:hypothetical protein